MAVNPAKAPEPSGGPRPRGKTKQPGGQEQVLRRSYIPEQYPDWLRANRLRPSDLRRLRDATADFDYRPLVSVLFPVYNPEKAWLERTLDSMMAQVYPDWELCVCDTSTEEHVRETLYRYGRLDDRIKVKRLEQNAGISGAAGEFVGFLGHEDKLSPDALFEVVRLLQENPEADLIYSDEDEIDENGQRFDPHFKPGWSPDLLLSRNYISHLGIYRKSILEDIGGFREGFEGCQGYDLLLRLTERTERVHHIPKVLYHRRTVTDQAASSREDEDHIRERTRRALGEALERRGVAGSVEDALVPNCFRVGFELRGEPKVSIVIPTRDNLSLLKNCIESIEDRTNYRNYEVLIVDNQSADPEKVEYLSSTPHQVLRFEEEFNYARINNFAVSRADGEYVLLLNDDTEVISGEWIEEMLRHAQREEVGAVGAKLLYPNGRIQHAGVVTGVGHPWQRGVATHAHQHYPADEPGHGGYAGLTRNYSAVTGACMMFRGSVFEEAGGLDEEHLAVNFNDVDFCLRLREKGYLIVFTPHAELYHHESASRSPRGHNPAEPLYMRKRWGEALDNDPYYNPNFSIGAADFNLVAADLRPRILREEESPEESVRHPLEMGREDHQRFIWSRQESARSSRRTALVPKALPPRDGHQKQRAADTLARREGAPPPFFVVGQPKSGTSWVRSTLNTHPEITCLGEGKFFGRDFKQGNPSSGGRLPSMYSLFVDSDDLKTWVGAAGHWIGSGGDEEIIQRELERHRKGLARAAMDYFLQDARERFGKPFVGDKTPVHTSYLEEIHDFYPDAKIIHIIRDGRDQAVSSVFHWWRESHRAVFAKLDQEVLRKKEAYYENRGDFGPDGESIFSENSLRGLARGWRENVANARELGPRLFGGRYFEVRYEDLLERPEPIFGEMISLLGANTDGEIVKECVRKNSFEARARNRRRGDEDPDSFFRKGVSGDWKNYFTARDKRIFDEEAGELLTRLGYESRGIGPRGTGRTTPA